MKKVFLVFSFFLLTPSFLAVSAYAGVSHLINQPILIPFGGIQPESQVLVGSSNPISGQVKGITSQIQTADARPLILAGFLEKHQSPLVPYDYFGEYLTELADKYDLDYRLLPSIMMQESNLCKKVPENSYNCLGLGVHSRGTWRFERYEDNFEAAAKVLKQNYIDKGLVTPEEIQKKYTPSSKGSWQFAVNHFMEVLETADY